MPGPEQHLYKNAREKSMTPVVEVEAGEVPGKAGQQHLKKGGKKQWRPVGEVEAGEVPGKAGQQYLKKGGKKQWRPVGEVEADEVPGKASQQHIWKKGGRRQWRPVGEVEAGEVPGKASQQQTRASCHCAGQAHASRAKSIENKTVFTKNLAIWKLLTYYANQRRDLAFQNVEIHQLTSWTAQNSGFLWYYTSGHIVLIIWIKFCRSYISSFLRKKWPTYPVLWWFLPHGDHYSIFCSFSWIQLNLIIFAKLLYNKIMFFSRKQGLARLNSFCGSPNDMYDSELCTFLPTLTAI